MSRMRIGRFKLKEGPIEGVIRNEEGFQVELRDYHSEVRYWNENRPN